MIKGGSMKSHTEELNFIVTDFNNVDIKLDDEDQAFKLYWSLSPSYKQLCGTLFYGRESIPLKDMKVTYLCKDILDKGLTCESGKGQDLKAFVLRGYPKERSYGVGDKKGPTSK